MFWHFFILRYASRHSRHTLSLLKVKRPRGNAPGFFYSHELALLNKKKSHELANYSTNLKFPDLELCDSQIASRIFILKRLGKLSHFLFSKDSESLGERVEVVLFSENKQSPKKLLNFYYLDSLCNYLHTLCKKLYNISINQKTLRRFYNVNKSCLYI